MGKDTSLKWFLFMLLDLATLVTGGALAWLYHHWWGWPIALLGLAGLGLAVYEITRKEEADEAEIDADLAKLQSPPE